MIQHPALEHDLRAWFEGDAPPSAPADLLPAVARAVIAQRQTPRWLAGGGIPSGIWIPSRVLVVMGLIIVLAALAAGAVAVLSQPRPLVLAVRANGLITFPDDNDLMVVDVDGSGRRALTVTPGSTEWLPTWSPDGSRIAYVRCLLSAAACEQEYAGAGAIMTVPASGGPETMLVPTHAAWVSSMAWSPDGSQLAYVHGESYVLSVVSSQGSTPRDLLSNVSSIVWSPDGRRLATATFPDQRITVVDVASGESRPITSADPALNLVGWSPDGSLIAFRRAENVKLPWRIEVIGPDGTGRRIIADTTADDLGVANPNSAGAFSPDGRLLGFTDVSGGHFNVAVIAPDGLGLRTVRRDSVFLGWSPDGRYLIVQPFDASGAPARAVALDGSEDLVFSVPWAGVWQAVPK